MRCDVCGNGYDKPIEMTYLGQTMASDSFECAIHAMASVCDHDRHFGWAARADNRLVFGRDRLPQGYAAAVLSALAGPEVLPCLEELGRGIAAARA